MVKFTKMVLSCYFLQLHFRKCLFLPAFANQLIYHFRITAIPLMVSQIRNETLNLLAGKSRRQSAVAVPIAPTTYLTNGDAMQFGAFFVNNRPFAFATPAGCAYLTFAIAVMTLHSLYFLNIFPLFPV